jgi:uncharacterized membrane protein YhaH (DUF805 family)
MPIKIPQLLWSFKGKINRLEYVWAIILAYPLLLLGVFFDKIFYLEPNNLTSQSVIALVFIVTIINFFYIKIAITCKRLSDIGWPLILTPLFLIPVVALCMIFVPGRTNNNIGCGAELPNL